MRMELGLSQHQTIKQIQTLSPQMYMSMEILCLNSLDLQERIETELENNETLELNEPTAPEPTDNVREAADAASESSTAAEAESDQSFEQKVEQWDRISREEYGSRRASSYSGERDDKLDALSNTEGRPTTLAEHLEQQIHLLEDADVIAVLGLRTAGRTEAEIIADIDAARDLCDAIIHNIDHRGYLMYDLEEIRASLDPQPEPDRLDQALRIVQSLDPPGIGGRGLEECLLLQLERDRQDYPLEERIIRDHLKDLGRNRLPKIAKALGVTLDEVKTAHEIIACLNPLPGKLFGAEPAAYVKPDVIVDETDGGYEVRVERGYLPRLQISSHYRDLYKESRSNADLRKYLKKKMDGAEWLLAAIRQRQSTLQRIAQETVKVQSEFFDHGISHLKPLKMVEIAERVGVHVSTISRAISGKYMETPRGIFPLKFFFTGGANKSDGTTVSRGSVIQRIKALIDEEDKSSPLSDIDIVRRLEESSIKISRRTVTKYREAEGIASSRERKIY